MSMIGRFLHICDALLGRLLDRYLAACRRWMQARLDGDRADQWFAQWYPKLA
ncbi:hypothetical protein [Bifidobacterium scardovii]|uniref:hypothetical protein n=1 Tax=Bifidobacterium scardovii TaxID=158787 RepID=UPI00242D96F2|nr:hypothetical protein [Bifidobacterium scardovii]MDU5887433.1 hypothetical protein [Bifidobacterium scardovii]MDU8981380.1 hypothetical protein [Bifidobacterium scardovii]